MRIILKRAIFCVMLLTIGLLSTQGCRADIVDWSALDSFLAGPQTITVPGGILATVELYNNSGETFTFADSDPTPNDDRLQLDWLHPTIVDSTVDHGIRINFSSAVDINSIAFEQFGSPLEVTRVGIDAGANFVSPHPLWTIDGGNATWESGGSITFDLAGGFNLEAANVTTLELGLIDSSIGFGGSKSKDWGLDIAVAAIPEPSHVAFLFFVTVGLLLPRYRRESV